MITNIGDYSIRSQVVHKAQPTIAYSKRSKRMISSS